MQSGTSIELTRDCDAVQIPHGSPALLPKGAEVVITQTLGGTYTVHAQGALYRIASKDADALGVAASESPAPQATTGAGTELDEKQVWETLRTCFDPEIPVNIVDLGLVYDLNVRKMPSGFSQVNIKMTLTAPGCGMGTVIARDAQEKLLGLDAVEEANVEIVWDPPWHQSMITEEGRRILGL
jgi:probable FeS assembly SUF system protein SufT